MKVEEPRVMYERLKEVRPSLMWVSKRRWSAEKCEQMRQVLDAPENVAWRIDEGEAIVEHDGQQVVARAGQWIFPKPGKRVQSFRGPLQFVSIAMEWVWPDGRYVYDEGLTRVVERGSFRGLDELVDQLLALVRGMWQKEVFYFGYEEVSMAEALKLFEAGVLWAQMYGRVMDEIGVVKQMPLTMDPRVERVMGALRGQLDRDLAEILLQLERDLGVSGRQLKRIVQSATGKTMVQHREQVLVQHARRMLLIPMMQVKAVAHELGFTDAAAFSKWFSRQVEISPSEYQKRFMGGGGDSS